MPAAPFASLHVDLGDANNNGTADLATSLIVGGKTLGPVVVDVPHAPALSLLTSLFTGANHGLIGIAAAGVGAAFPKLFGEMPSWVKNIANFAVSESVGAGG